MISEFTTENEHGEKRTFHLAPAEKENDENIFTVITGKNGTGKSQLLSEIAKRFIATPNSITPEKNKVITASSSPFDRFPIYKNRNNYSYQGYARY